MSFDSHVDLFVEVAFADRTYMETLDGHATTPDSASLSVSGDIDIRFFGAAESWASGSVQELVQKVDNSAGDASFRFSLTTGGFLFLEISQDGSTFPGGSPASSVAVDAAEGEELGVRATWRQSDGRVQFFTSRDDGDTWTQLGTDETLSVSSIFDTTAPVDVGGESLQDRSFVGRTYRAEILDGIDGTTVASLDFTDSGQGWVVGDDAGDTGTDDQNNVWTLQGDAEIDDAVRPFDLFPVWSDATTLGRGVQIGRGKSSLDGHFGAGYATVRLDNRDGRFSPHNTAGTHYPHVKIGNQVRVRAVHSASSTDVTLFRGFVEAWPIDYPHSGKDSVVEVPCVDAFKLLSTFPLRGLSYPAQSTSDRVRAVLDDVMFPLVLRDIDEGVANVPAVTFDEDKSALDHLLDVADAEVGRFFVTAAGEARFTNRVVHSGGVTSQATFGPSNLSYQKVAVSYDDDYLYNEAGVTREGGTQQKAEDQESIKSFGRRQLSKDLPLENDPHALNVAEWLVALYADQKVRIRSIEAVPIGNDDVWEQVLNRELVDVLTVEVPAPGGDSLNQDCAIDRIVHDFLPKQWRTKWDLSPLVDLQTTEFWVLGTSDDLGTDTILA